MIWALVVVHDFSVKTDLCTVLYTTFKTMYRGNYKPILRLQSYISFEEVLLSA